MNNLFGKSHFVSNGIQGNIVIAVETDQRCPKDVIITSSNSIKVYEINGRTISESWVLKSWLTPLSGCLTSATGDFFCPVAHNALIKWTSDVKSLESLTPLKFGNDINSLCAVGGAVHIVFAGGCVVEVSEALYHKKSRRPNLVPLSLTIKEVKVFHGFVTVVAAPKDGRDCSSIFHYRVGCTDASQVTEFSLSRPALTLAGVGLLTYCSAITLWSNGELCSSAVHSGGGGGRATLRLRVLGNCGASIDCSRPARILRLYDTHVAVLGLDISKDGGRISLLDVELGLEVSRRNFKLYQTALRCWAAAGDEGGALLLHERRELTVVPLLQRPPRGVAQLLTEEPLPAVYSEEIVVRNWGKESLAATSMHLAVRPATASCIDDLIKKLKLITLDESLCCKALVQEALKKRSIKLACEIMIRFRSFIPECCIVDLLSLLLAADSASLNDAANTYVDLASLDLATPLSFDSFIDHLERKKGCAFPKTAADHPKHISRTPPPVISNKRQENWSKKKRKNAGKEGKLLNGYEKLINGQSSPALPNGHHEPMELGVEIPVQGGGGCSPVWGGGWLLVYPLLCSRFTQLFLTSELKRLPFRDALSLLNHLLQLSQKNLSSVSSLISDDFIRYNNKRKKTNNGFNSMKNGQTQDKALDLVENVEQSALNSLQQKVVKSPKIKSNECLQKVEMLSKTAGSGGNVLQVMVPHEATVHKWIIMINDAHQQTILLEQQLLNTPSQDALVLDQCKVEEFEVEMHSDYFIEKFCEDLDNESSGATAPELSTTDQQYSIERITLPW
ncbi:uncharacterized protein LOC108681377 [Hyalella azteca]|uniref:Uncharacterized protein LOC108681377 n=1 Tax=Hyalella azteca TaxID=294128 RepID=A0A8B7PIA4_HYAAZ|nr:uncharacterized protein LOC108681377 [Hyalella azteca]